MDYSEKLVVKGLKAGDTEAYQYIYAVSYTHLTLPTTERV